MIVFSAFLFIFTAEWTVPLGQDIEGEGTGQPGSLGYDVGSGEGFATGVILAGGGILFGSAVTGGIMSFVTRNHAWTGAGILCGIIFGLYTVGMSTVANMFQSYSFGIHIWTIFNFCFSVIAIIAVMEVFTGRSVDD